MSRQQYWKDLKKAIVRSWTIGAFVLATAFTVFAENYSLLEGVISKEHYPYIIVFAMLLGRLKGINTQVKNK